MILSVKTATAPAAQLPNNQRLSRFLYLLPALFSLWLYWYGLKAWFQQDDFAWLSLHTQIWDFRSFLTQMFAPMAQGTIRPWSERGFFLLFYRLFETNALPYRILVFATQTANLLLVSWIVLRLTRSRLASLAAPILWTANSALSTPMAWTSDYNQILCAAFLLGAFALHLKHRYRAEFAVFVLGFGALELNIIYPALLLAYVLAAEQTKRRILRTLPFFAVSLAYFLLHSLVAPRVTEGPYALHWDAGLFATLPYYWQLALVPEGWTVHHLFRLTTAAVAAFSFILLGHAAWQARLGRLLPSFFLLWFLITLAPVLPLRDHISAYYLTIPALGLALLWADALTASAPAPRALSAALALLFLFLQIPEARLETRWQFERSRQVRSLVLGVRQARALHPGKTILLDDISPDLAMLAVAHSAFYALDMPDVYLTPQSAQRLGPSEALDHVEQFILPTGAARYGLAAGHIEVYSATTPRLRNITSLYEQMSAPQMAENYPRRVDIGLPLMTYLLGSSWYPLEGNHRWMPKRASLRMGGPLSDRANLIVSGFCPPESTESSVLDLTIQVDGTTLPPAQIGKPETSFSRTFRLPPSLAGKQYVDVTLEVSRTFRVGPRDRELGLAFGTLEIQ